MASLMNSIKHLITNTNPSHIISKKNKHEEKGIIPNSFLGSRRYNKRKIQINILNEY